MLFSTAATAFSGRARRALVKPVRVRYRNRQMLYRVHVRRADCGIQLAGRRKSEDRA
jgi:hypothetical protein